MHSYMSSSESASVASNCRSSEIITTTITNTTIAPVTVISISPTITTTTAATANTTAATSSRAGRPRSGQTVACAGVSGCLGVYFSLFLIIFCCILTLLECLQNRLWRVYFFFIYFCLWREGELFIIVAAPLVVSSSVHVFFFLYSTK